MTGLEGRNLERFYGHWKVVNQVSIEVQRGEVVGLLGPNGAGKTTTFYLIVGLLRVDGGQILPMSRRERAERLAALLEELNITHLADRKGYNLSGGERRRVEITRALVTHPKFLLLDEPFVGIDPIAVGEIQDIVGRLRQRGLGILITDHNVRETLSTTDRAYIMFEGKILLEGTSQELAEDPIARQIYLGERFRLD